MVGVWEMVGCEEGEIGVVDELKVMFVEGLVKVRGEFMG